MTQSYTLNLINNKTKQTYKVFQVDGFNTIGVEELEDFTIAFRNITPNRVQVRISVDGTDVLTGKPASTEASGEMFIVNGYQTLDLKAWAEDTRGGAAFLFTALKDSVAANTHGNTSSKGIIAVAVYEEGYVERNNWLSGNNSFGKRNSIGGNYKSMESRDNTKSASGDRRDMDMICERGLSLDSDDVDYTSSCTYGAVPCSAQSEPKEEKTKGTIFPSDRRLGAVLRSKNLGVGAGERVDQTITKIAGFKKPVFTEIMQMKYMDWAELHTRVRMDSNKLSYPHPGFPGDAEKMCNLGSTPRYKKVEEEISIGVIKRQRFNRSEIINKLSDISRFYE